MNKISSTLFLLSLVLLFLIGVVWQKIEKIKSEPAQPQKTQGTNLATGKLGTEVTSKIPIVNNFDHVRGDRASKIKIISYLDFECKFCREFYETAQKVAVTYSGQVATVFRHYPLDTLHPDARNLAEAAECVAMIQGNEAFFEFADKLFVEAQNGNVGNETVEKLADEASVDIDEFKKCVDGSEVSNIVEAQYQGGLAAGVRGTPQGFVVNDKGDAWLIPESLPEEQIETLIDEALK